MRQFKKEGWDYVNIFGKRDQAERVGRFCAVRVEELDFIGMHEGKTD